MTTSSIYTQSVTFSWTLFAATRVSVSGAASAASTPEAPSAAPAVDAVELSPDARAAASSPDGGATGAASAQGEPAPESQPGQADTESGQPESRAARRAGALLNALDANEDGSISEQEFTEGALALLRRAGARHRHRTHHDDSGLHRGETRRGERLERRLDRAFERVDANDDGGIDAGELTTALARGRGRHHAVSNDEVPTSPPPAAPGPAESTGTVSVTTVTFVAVAIQQYTAIDHLS